MIEGLGKLLSRRVILFGGKGGVGKTTVTAVVARAAVDAGMRVALVELDGKPFMALNGGPEYKHSPALSFAVDCRTQQEVDHYWTRLVEGGQPVQCGWLTDRFGVSWMVGVEPQQG